MFNGSNIQETYIIVTYMIVTSFGFLCSDKINNRVTIYALDRFNMLNRNIIWFLIRIYLLVCIRSKKLDLH